jgi:EAL domain-containing protein (putative c-di-GMP-specific phosphodiesterase class I)
LAKFQTDLVKFDMELIRGIDRDRAKQKILRHSLRMMSDLGITSVCEGIETEAEYEVLRDMGCHLMQGYLFAKPALEALSAPTWPGEVAQRTEAG